MKIARIVYLFFILISIIITPYLAEYATNIRGYKAYGGEYLTPILGWIIATIYYDICENLNNTNKNKEKKL